MLIGIVRRGHDVTFAAAGLPELDLCGLDNAAARDVLAGHAADLSYADQERIFREAAGNPLPPAWSVPSPPGSATCRR